jgi:hypothetical protein
MKLSPFKLVECGIIVPQKTRNLMVGECQIIRQKDDATFKLNLFQAWCKAHTGTGCGSSEASQKPEWFMKTKLYCLFIIMKTNIHIFGLAAGQRQKVAPALPCRRQLQCFSRRFSPAG